MRLVTGLRVRRRLRWMAHPSFYAVQSGRPEWADDQRGAIADFLETGQDRGLRISTLFNAAWYADRLAERGLSAEGQPPFLHFLSTGWDLRIVPTPLFDAGWFAQRHPRLSAELERAGRWSFEHYVTEGCYEPGWVPSPVGSHHSGGEPARPPSSGRPLLLRQMLHHADRYDLGRTSWLEEGVTAALRAYDSLQSPAMRELVAHAATLEPLIAASETRRPAVFCPPYRGPRVHLASVAEDVRRRIGVDSAATVVLAADLAGAPEADGLVIGTDRPSTGTRAHFIDLADDLAAFDATRRLDLLLDVVRGLTPTKITVAGSLLGAELVESYVRQLGATAAVEQM